MSDDTGDALAPTSRSWTQIGRLVPPERCRLSTARPHDMTAELGWVVLTQGTRPHQVLAAIKSIRANGMADEIVVVENGGPSNDYGTDVQVITSTTNVGIPGGRHLGLRSTHSGIVAFLDDDAELVSPEAGNRIVSAMLDDVELGVLSFRIVDEAGATQRRHVPRPGSRSANRSGPVGTFLGGACAIRREAYEAVGGYWSDLFYAHEELDLAWRLYDAGYRAGYLAEIVVKHPQTPISRHAEGWRLTGRNRVLVARRNLPWPLVLAHTLAWLVVGMARAPGARTRGAYAGGWLAGWRTKVSRQPIRWQTVARLTRAGRPPIV